MFRYDSTRPRDELLEEIILNPEYNEVELRVAECEVRANREGMYAGHMEEHFRGYIDVTLLWKELYQAVMDFTEPNSKSNKHTKIEQDIIEKLSWLKKAVLCQCKPRSLPVPYCNIKEISKGRYIQVEDEKAREKSKIDNSAYRMQYKRISNENTVALLKSLRFILGMCEGKWGIKAKKANKYDERFLVMFSDDIKADWARKIKINLSQFSNTKSKKLLENLIRSPAGVSNVNDIYGKQPTGVKDLLKRNGHDYAAKHIHKRKDEIIVSDKIKLIAKNNPA